MQWLWGTPILAIVDEKAARGNAPIAAHLRRLAATETPEIRSNRNGAWQSRNKAFLVPDSHAADSGIRGHVKRLRAGIARALRQYLETHLAETDGAMPEFEVTIDASWANVNPPCGINGPHVHPFSAISGAYYVACGGNATAEKPCTISLMDPRPSAPLAHLPAEVRDSLDFGIDWTLSLWPGTVLVFPSWLQHWVPPHAPGGGARITVSFNAGVRLLGSARLPAGQGVNASALPPVRVEEADQPLDG